MLVRSYRIIEWLYAYRIGVGRVRPVGRLRRPGLWAPGRGGRGWRRRAGEWRAPRGPKPGPGRSPRPSPSGTGCRPGRGPRASVGRFSLGEVWMPSRRAGRRGSPGSDGFTAPILWTRSDTCERDDCDFCTSFSLYFESSFRDKSMRFTGTSHGNTSFSSLITDSQVRRLVQIFSLYFPNYYVITKTSCNFSTLEKLNHCSPLL